MGAQLLQEVARKTSDIAYHGTAAATIFAHSILREGLKPAAAGTSPMDFKRGIAKAGAGEEIKKRSNKVKDAAEIAQAAAVSTVAAFFETANKNR